MESASLTREARCLVGRTKIIKKNPSGSFFIILLPSETSPSLG